jgi:hypothetical protein
MGRLVAVPDLLGHWLVGASLADVVFNFVFGCSFSSFRRKRGFWYFG